jgi:hypothetical protein
MRLPWIEPNLDELRIAVAAGPARSAKPGSGNVCGGGDAQRAIDSSLECCDAAAHPGPFSWGGGLGMGLRGKGEEQAEGEKRACV